LESAEPPEVENSSFKVNKNRLGWSVAKLTVLVIVGFAVLQVRLPFLILAPGPTRDVGTLVKIGAPTYQSRGSFLLTTALITEPDGVTLPKALGVILDRNKDLIPKTAIFPSNSTRVNTDRVHAAQMSESQEVAAVAALSELRLAVQPDGSFVREAKPDVPASKELRPGDVIVSIEGKAANTTQDVLDGVQQVAPGALVRVTVRREGQLKDFVVKTIPSAKDPKKAAIGVTIIQDNKLPFEIAIDAGDIGGPSAGLMFALTIYDALSPGDLTHGQKIAGTGTIENPKDRLGAVGPIGAVEQKIKTAADQGVKTFLVPRAELNQAKAAAPGTMKIIGVSSLHEAIMKLENLP